MAPDTTADAATTQLRDTIKDGQNTALLIWLLISVSAAVIMAQDTVAGWETPRLSTLDATAKFTKILVIHGLWLLTTLGFIATTIFAKPTRLWRLHVVAGAVIAVWTVAVMIWAASDVRMFSITTWSCTEIPTTEYVTDEFRSSCKETDAYSDIHLGPNIYMWSMDDSHFWRWIVPGEGRTTVETKWPQRTQDMYMSSTDNGAFMQPSLDSNRGGMWIGNFDPEEHRSLNLYYIEVEQPADDAATPAP